jgi:hypothetical protein
MWFKVGMLALDSRAGPRPKWKPMLVALTAAACGGRTSLSSGIDEDASVTATGGFHGEATGGSGVVALGGQTGGSGGAPATGDASGSGGAEPGSGGEFVLPSGGSSVDLPPEYAACAGCSPFAWCDRGANPPACVCPPGWEGDGNDCTWPLSRTAFARVATGSGFNCGLRFDGTVTCFLDGSGEQLDWEGRFLQIDAGNSQACGVREDQGLYCWAEAVNTYNLDPNPVPDGAYQQVACGRNFNCGLLATGAVSCWGDVPEDLPATLPGPFSQISAGSYECDVRGCTSGGRTLCALSPDGGADCRGAPLGADLPAGNFFAIDTSGNDVCLLAPDGKAHCTLSTLDESYVQLANSGTDLCALRVDGRVDCAPLAEGEPTLVPPDDLAFQHISCITTCRNGQCSSHCCGVTADGRISCW